jgi:hypothetical protein
VSDDLQKLTDTALADLGRLPDHTASNPSSDWAIQRDQEAESHFAAWLHKHRLTT